MCGATISAAARYQTGDQPPNGYSDWHDWAQVQIKAGLKQLRCGRCGLLKFPQELSKVVDRREVKARHAKVKTFARPVCAKCVLPSDAQQPTDALL